MSTPPHIRRQPLYWGPPSLRHLEIQRPESTKLQRKSQLEQPQSASIFKNMKKFLLRIFRSHQSATQHEVPRSSRLLNLPQELIDIILDMAIVNEIPETTIIIRISPIKHAKRPSMLSSTLESLDPFTRFPFILPPIPTVFQLNHATRINLLRRHSANILKLSVPGYTHQTRPWIYRHPSTNQLRLTSSHELPEFSIALFMRCISPQLIVTRALKISTLKRWLCTPAYEVRWRVDLLFVDGEEREEVLGANQVGQPQMGGRVWYSNVFHFPKWNVTYPAHGM